MASRKKRTAYQTRSTRKDKDENSTPILEEKTYALAEATLDLLEQNELIEAQKIELSEANLKLLELNELLEKQKFELAEANLKLLELNELYEKQKFELAEANLKMLEQNEIIRMEREKSEKLLLNILPVRVADDLKETGKTLPQKFEHVTVYFSDIVGFTNISGTLDPGFLIAELNDIFTAMDNIFESKQCERIKTIGDAYLAVCGMPEANDRHAENIIEASIEIIDYIRARNSKGIINWDIRIGIHSGSLVGGVVGIKKYIYDVFGDTVNIANRMESNSEPMRINVSEKTYELAKDKFTFIPRDPIEVKGVGKMKMYFVAV
jgi:class 3 adenylate cyclase